MSRKSARMTVLYDENDNLSCHCRGGFWKHCSMRLANDLPCFDAIVSATPIEKEHDDKASLAVRSLDKSLKNLQDGLRNLDKKFKI